MPIPASTSSASGPRWLRAGLAGQPHSAGAEPAWPGRAGSVSRHDATRAIAAPAVHASQPSRLTTRPVPRDAPPETTSPRSETNSPSVTALSPRANSAPSLAALGRDTLSAIGPALIAQAIT